MSIASRHIMRVCLTTRLREALLPTDLSVPLTHPPIHLPACLPDPCDAMAPCTTDSIAGNDYCTASNNPFRGYECSAAEVTDSCIFNVADHQRESALWDSGMDTSSTCNDLCAHFGSTCFGAFEGSDNLCAGLDAASGYWCTDPLSSYGQSGHIFCSCSSELTTGEYQCIACLNLT